MRARSWLLLQLADGTFPSGGFAHSSGLEAAVALGGTDDLERFVDQSLRQAGRASLPFVRAAAAAPARLEELDVACDASLPLSGPNRASRALGRALASAASAIYDGPAMVAVVRVARAGPSHHAPVFGAALGALGLAPDDAAAAYLHGAARGILSAAVRLGLAGPLEAQRMLAERADLLDAIHSERTDVERVAQTSPLLELYAALHDRLEARMFQS